MKLLVVKQTWLMSNGFLTIVSCLVHLMYTMRLIDSDYDQRHFKIPALLTVKLEFARSITGINVSLLMIGYVTDTPYLGKLSCCNKWNQHLITDCSRATWILLSKVLQTKRKKNRGVCQPLSQFTVVSHYVPYIVISKELSSLRQLSLNFVDLVNRIFKIIQRSYQSN